MKNMTDRQKMRWITFILIIAIFCILAIFTGIASGQETGNSYLPLVFNGILTPTPTRTPQPSPTYAPTACPEFPEPCSPTPTPHTIIIPPFTDDLKDIRYRTGLEYGMVYCMWFDLKCLEEEIDPIYYYFSPPGYRITGIGIYSDYDLVRFTNQSICEGDYCHHIYFNYVVVWRYQDSGSIDALTFFLLPEP
jgi:hypothetical protein